MHTPEINEHAADETISSNNLCQSNEVQVPSSAVVDLTIIESLHQSVAAHEFEQDSSVLQSTVISYVREHTSETASPVFDRRHVPLKHSELTSCSVQLFSDDGSDSIEKSANIPQQSSANDSPDNNSTVLAVSDATGNQMKSNLGSQRSVLPKIVPVVYVNSDGKPTRYELIQPVPSPSYFNGSTPLDDKDTVGQLSSNVSSSDVQGYDTNNIVML